MISFAVEFHEFTLPKGKNALRYLFEPFQYLLSNTSATILGDENQMIVCGTNAMIKCI
jgi:hypothetical protein